jgi:hypothetical protein
LDGSRKILFEALDRPALRPLPPERYELGAAPLKGDHAAMGTTLLA